MNPTERFLGDYKYFMTKENGDMRVILCWRFVIAIRARGEEGGIARSFFFERGEGEDGLVLVLVLILGVGSGLNGLELWSSSFFSYIN